MNLKYRILIVLGLIAASVYALFPRNVIERVKGPDGSFVYDTVKRVPLKRGLDLQGGMHLALEVDESKARVPDKSEALDRALKVVRTRIDQFGVLEPLVQKSGSDRIIVVLPGIDDPERAQEVVQKSAFLQFQITDETQSLERALPRLDAAVKNRASTAAAPVATDTANRRTTGISDLLTTDTASVATTDSARADTTKADTAALGASGGGVEVCWSSIPRTEHACRVRLGAWPRQSLLSRTSSAPLVRRHEVAQRIRPTTRAPIGEG